VMQYSAVRGWNIDVDRLASKRGTLLMRNDRSNIVVWVDSLRNIAFERISNDARIRSMHVLCKSPFKSQL